MTAAVNGAAGVPRRPLGQPRQVGTPQEPVALGSKPLPATPAPADGHRLVGKQLTDAVAGILAAGSSVAEEDGDDGEGEAAEQGSARGGRAEDGRVDEGAGETESGGESESGSSADDETSLDDLARALQVSPKELNKVTLKVGDQKLTLGELKAKLPALAKAGSGARRIRGPKADDRARADRCTSPDHGDHRQLPGPRSTAGSAAACQRAVRTEQACSGRASNQSPAAMGRREVRGKRAACIGCAWQAVRFQSRRAGQHH